ncbi:MAG: hypothetical protein LBN42_01520 [Oscillospiraceae bacterium]|jgi:hypothetical protein|nr:hypothetical protein [Oscillospiraceae bacterium]
MIEGFFLSINGEINIGRKCITLCCENLANVPGVAFAATPKETIDNFRELRDNIIAESKAFAVSGSQPAERKYTSVCNKCVNYLPDEWQSDGLIHYVNLSMYPAPCQCKCIYCYVNRTENAKDAADSYETLFALIEYAKEKNLIIPSAFWQVSTGEITIHPFKKRIIDLVRGRKTIFYTNTFMFDTDIAENMRVSPNSAINLSIDSGIPQTWHKVKGVDNFGKVIDNLRNYFITCGRVGQITLKYIILPGVNDSTEDYLSLISIMKVLQVRYLDLARDTTVKYSQTAEQRGVLIQSSACFVALLRDNDMSYGMFNFSTDEREDIENGANDLLKAWKEGDRFLLDGWRGLLFRDDAFFANDDFRLLVFLHEAANTLTALFESRVSVAEKVSVVTEIFKHDNTKAIAAKTDLGASVNQTARYIGLRNTLFSETANWLIDAEEIPDEYAEDCYAVGAFICGTVNDEDRAVRFKKLLVEYLIETERFDEADTILTEIEMLHAEDDEVLALREVLGGVLSGSPI